MRKRWTPGAPPVRSSRFGRTQTIAGSSASSTATTDRPFTSRARGFELLETSGRIEICAIRLETASGSIRYRRILGQHNRVNVFLRYFGSFSKMDLTLLNCAIKQRLQRGRHRDQRISIVLFRSTLNCLRLENRATESCAETGREVSPGLQSNSRRLTANAARC